MVALAQFWVRYKLDGAFFRLLVKSEYGPCIRLCGVPFSRTVSLDLGTHDNSQVETNITYVNTQGESKCGYTCLFSKEGRSSLLHHPRSHHSLPVL